MSTNGTPGAFMGDHDADQEINLLDLCARMGITLSIDTDAPCGDRSTPKCEYCRGRGCQHCRDPNYQAQRMTQPTAMAAPIAVEMDENHPQVLVCEALNTGLTKQMTPQRLVAAIANAAVSETVSHKLWASDRATHLLGEAVDQEASQALWLARNREAHAPRAARQSVSHVAKLEQRGRQLTFVAQVSYLALQPELAAFQRKAIEWATTRLKCKTGLRAQTESMRTLMQAKDHTEVISARTILDTDKIVDIFGAESLQDELQETLTEIVEGPEHVMDPANVKDFKELCGCLPWAATQMLQLVRVAGR